MNIPPLTGLLEVEAYLWELGGVVNVTKEQTRAEGEEALEAGHEQWGGDGGAIVREHDLVHVDLKVDNED